MHVLVTLKNGQIKTMKALESSKHSKYMGIFPDAQGQLTPQSQVFKLTQAFMIVLVTCKNEGQTKSSLLNYRLDRIARFFHEAS